MGFLKSLIGRTVEPDLEFAAEGFMMVALTRANHPEINLHDFELSYAHQLLGKGCSEHQALSARWGGVHAIAADLMMYDCAIEVAKDITGEQGTVEAGEETAALLRSNRLDAAAFMMRKTLEADSKEFSRFLKHVGH